jgi:hypothetical protein
VKVLVVNANLELLPNPVVPLGACLAASAARGAGFETAFLDLAFEKDPAKTLHRALDRFAPDAVGVSIRNIDNTDFLSPRLYLPPILEKIVAPALRRCPDRVVLGGAGFSTLPEEILEFMGAPAGVVGDAEETFPRLLARWREGRDLEGIPSVVRLCPGGVVREAPAAPSADLDAYPRARCDGWVNLARYAAFGGWANVQTKRGCPLRCAYCVYNRVEGKTYRFRSPASVREEIEALHAAGVRDVEFTDSTFNVPIDHAKAVLRELTKAPVSVRLHTAGMNPLQADEELFHLMREGGFASIMISAESASDAALEGLGKGYDASAVRRILRLTEEAGFDAFWYFLFGGPGETEATVEETFRFLDREIPPRHLVYLGAGIRIQKGAPVESIARAEGVLGPDDGLLDPRFYFSPALSRDGLLDRIRREILAHPNYIQVMDYQRSRAPLWLARVLGWLRYRRPSWTLVPAINRLFARLGRKRR